MISLWLLLWLYIMLKLKLLLLLLLTIPRKIIIRFLFCSRFVHGHCSGHSYGVIPCQNKEKKCQCQKITFLWRNMKEYRVLICFLPFSASVWFLGPFWNFFSKFSKKDHFQKINIEKLYLLFNLVSLDLTRSIKYSR